MLNNKFNVQSAKFLVKHTLSKLSINQIADLLRKSYEAAGVYVPPECMDTEFTYIAQKIKEDPDSLSEQCLLTIFKGVD